MGNWEQMAIAPQRKPALGVALGEGVEVPIGILIQCRAPTTGCNPTTRDIRWAWHWAKVLKFLSES